MIMDGNGRWATARGKPRIIGHRAGAQAVRRIVEAARGGGYGIGTLTLYAFSADNWYRPDREVAALMRLFRSYLASETARCVENGIRLSVIGRRDRLAEPVRLAVEAAEAATEDGEHLHLRLAIDYSAREAILRAAASGPAASHDEFEARLAAACHASNSSPPVDLLIRTGGEQRLSDFLLWECAYAELFFTPQMWPDFDAKALAGALRDFRSRERRFGALPQAAAG